MNIHSPASAKERWPQFEFIGRPFLKGKRKYIRVKYRDVDCQRLLGRNGMVYSFDDDFIWFGNQWADLKF